LKRRILENALKELYHPNKTIRKHAAQKFALSAPRWATAQLQQALVNEVDIKVGKWLALALAKIGDPHSRQTVSNVLQATEIGDDRDWLLLADAVLSKSEKNRTIGDLLKSKSDESLKQAAQLLWMEPNPDIELKRLLKLTEHDDRNLRRWAILAAGKAKLNTVDGIKHGLIDDDYLVREWTECALSNHSTITSPTLLIPGLNDTHPRVREWAVKALAATKKEEIPEILTQHLKEESDLDCREAVYRSLSFLPKNIDINKLLAAAAVNEESAPVMMAVIDLMTSDPKAAKDEDLLKHIDTKCKEIDHTFLTPYLLDRLWDISSNKEKKAIKTLSASPQSIFVLNGNKNLEIQKRMRSKTQRPVIGIVIALKEEFRVFAKTVESMNPLGNGFYRFVSKAGSILITGVVKLVGAKGAIRALQATRDLIDEYSPSIIVNIGIAGSIDSDILLCDVIVGTQITDYLHDSKATTTGETWEFQLSGDPYPIAFGLLTQALNFEFEYPAAYKQWITHASVFETDILKPELKIELVNKGAIRNYPDSIEAKIASGPTVGASVAFSKWLQAKCDRSYKVLEMESAGVAAATTLTASPVPTLVIRGISDFGDERKNDLENESGGTIRTVAMANATYFLMALLENLKI